MAELTTFYLALGALFLVGLLAHLVGERTRLPRGSLLLLAGFLLGPSFLDVVPGIGEAWTTGVTEVALMMVAFLLGGHLHRDTLRQRGRIVLAVSTAVSLGTAAFVGGTLALVGVPLAAALLLGGISTPTAPASTTDVIDEVHADGDFTETVMGIVAVDDAWGIIVFSVFLAAAGVVEGVPPATALGVGLRDVVGAVVLGAAVGAPAAFLTGRIRPGEPTLAEALGVVLVTGGAALWFDVSFLLAGIIAGAVVTNLATHHERPFHALEEVEWPFLILFFILAGARFEVHALLTAGVAGGAFLAARVVGRLVSGWLGARAGGASAFTQRWIGASLLGQAGVALGLALVAAERFPSVEEVVLPVAVGTTVVFELVGPPLLRLALERSGEAGAGEGV